MNKQYPVRKRNQTWHTLNVGRSEVVHVRNVDQKIMKRMPSSTDTFVERNAIRSIILRVRHFIKSGN